MTDALTTGRAFFLMVGLIVFGICLAFAVGLAHDSIVNILVEHGIDAGQGTDWDSTREVNIITSLLYFVCSLPPLLGAYIFLITITRRSRRTDFYESGELYMQEE